MNDVSYIQHLQQCNDTALTLNLYIVPVITFIVVLWISSLLMIDYQHQNICHKMKKLKKLIKNPFAYEECFEKSNEEDHSSEKSNEEEEHSSDESNEKSDHSSE